MNGWQSLGFRSYQEYLFSDIWQDRRKEMLKKHPYCEICHSKATEIHHRHYENAGDEKEKDLMSLCKICHRRMHDGI